MNDRLAGTIGGYRRAPLIAEIVALAAVAVADTVTVLQQPPGPSGLFATGLNTINPAIGTAAGVLTVLRRRFDRVGFLTVVIAAASLVVSGLIAAAEMLGTVAPANPILTETLALGILCGAACHRLPARVVGPLVVLAGAAMTAGPLLRYGLESRWSLLAVPAALLWGGSIGTGLVLRDAGNRYAASLATARSAERLALARELHDLVAHHITGIVVLAQGAQALTARRPATTPSAPEDQAVYAEIERAGGEALAAMRRMVGMLRTDPAGAGPVPGGATPDPADGASARIAAELRDASGDDPRVRVTVADQLDQVPLPSPVLTAVHRIVLEAVTNARRHGVSDTPIEVSARLERRGFTAALILDVHNLVAERTVPGEGYGILGMKERAQALGGTLSAGPDDHGSAPQPSWRVTARLPVDPGPGQGIV